MTERGKETIVPSPSLPYDAEYWRKRAEETRALAEKMSDAHKKILLLGIAEIYEQVAKSDESLCGALSLRRYRSVGMVRRPTIAMGDFVSSVSRNGRLFIVRQNNIAGAIAHPRASDTPRRSAL
jgi:hypothetical protein